MAVLQQHDPEALRLWRQLWSTDEKPAMFLVPADRMWLANQIAEAEHHDELDRYVD